MNDDIKAIRDALAAGPTPGPWIDDRHEKAVYPYTQVRAPERPGRGVVADIRLSDVASFSCTIGKAEQEWKNAAYIAAVHPERIARLLDALEAATKDAERYRWLRDAKYLDLRSEYKGTVWKRKDGSTFHSSHSLCAGGTRFAPYETLDAAIDAAMKGDA